MFSLFAQEGSSGHSKFQKPWESPSGLKHSQNGQKRQASKIFDFLCFVFDFFCLGKKLRNSHMGLFAIVCLIFSFFMV